MTADQFHFGINRKIILHQTSYCAGWVALCVCVCVRERGQENDISFGSTVKCVCCSGTTQTGSPKPPEEKNDCQGIKELNSSKTQTGTDTHTACLDNRYEKYNSLEPRVRKERCACVQTTIRGIPCSYRGLALC